MSWKLAELRWRHDVGLNEKSGRKRPGGAESLLDRLNNHNAGQARRGRSYTAPWCRAVVESDLYEHPSTALNTIRSDLTLQALSPGLTATSTTPLLQTIAHNKYRPLTQNRFPSPPRDMDTGKQDTALARQQTPSEHFWLDRRTDTPHPSEYGRTRQETSDGNLTLPDIRTPPPRLRTGSGSPLDDLPSLDGRSVLDFQFSRTPSFGLHFRQRSQSTRDRDNLPGQELEQSEGWTGSQPRSPLRQRTSLESTHHSDSALLQNISTDLHTCRSSPDRSSTRQLYPDLPSAYEKIQARRATSLQPIPSNTRSTRFPLSPSDSSSDEEPLLPIPCVKDAVPLRNLPSRKVCSAHIVLHEAQRHPESSAIVETSTGNTESRRAESQTSTTLEDIVSQYADASLSDFPVPASSPSLAGPSDLQMTDAKCDREATTAVDPLHVEPRGLHRTSLVARAYQIQQWADKGFRSPVDDVHESADEDEEWETEQKNSRSSFLTPSKLRFRLKKRRTAETSISTTASGWTGRIPTSPWDPLSTSTQSRQPNSRPRLHHRHRTITHQNLLSPSQSRQQKSLLKSKRIRVRQKQPLGGKEETRDTEAQLYRPTCGDARTPSPLRQPRSSPPSLCANRSTRTSSKSARHSNTLSISHPLASSSLLPKTVDHLHARSLLPPSVKVTSVDPSHPVTGHTERELSPFDINGGKKMAKNTNSGPPDALGHTQNRAPQSERSITGLFAPVDSATTFETLAPQGNPYPFTATTQSQPSQTELLLARSLCDGGYTWNDSDLSRFLRDSRRLRHGLESEQDFAAGHSVFYQRAIQATGSSVADISSTSTTLARLRSANTSTSASHYSDEDEPAMMISPPTRRFVHFLMATRSEPGEASSGYTTLGLSQPPMEEGGRAFLVSNEAPISADARGVQRKAGALLLALGGLTYLVGGWTLIRSMGEGGPLATTAMADLTRMLVGGEEGVVCCVHPVDAAMARAIERAILVFVVVLGVGWLAVVSWLAATV